MGFTSSSCARFAVPAILALSALVMIPDWASQVHQSAWFGTNGDGGYFAGKGSILLGPHALTVYSDRTLQSGPWQLLIWRALALLGGQRGSMVAGIVAVTVLAVTVYLVARWVLAGRPYRNVLALGVAVLLVIWGPLPESYDSGHLAQVAIPLLWIVAAELARRERALLAGLLLGLATGMETWGVLGAALILILPDLRAWTITAATACAVAVATYLPFVASGTFEMFQMHWGVTNETLVHLVVPAGTPFTYQFRLVQVLAAAAVSSAAVLLARRSTSVVWLVVGLPVAARLVLDAQVYDYYLVPLRIAGVVAIAMLLSDRRLWPALVMLVATALTFADGQLTPWLPVVAFGAVATVVGIRARSMLRSGDIRPPTAQGSPATAENH